MASLPACTGEAASLPAAGGGQGQGNGPFHARFPCGPSSFVATSFTQVRALWCCVCVFNDVHGAAGT